MQIRNLFGLVTLLPLSANAEMQLNLTQGVTQVSREVYDLHMLVLGICTVIGIIVFGVMIWSMIFHRKSKGAKSADFHESTKIEILWTVIPIILLVAMAIPATLTLIKMENNDDADLTIQITGSQWKWHYKYFDQDLEFYSILSTPREQYENLNGTSPNKNEHYLLEVDNPLVIPSNKKVRFLITSDDVIHAWWVPAFAVKQDANPGFINEAWTIAEVPGIYRGQCAELCGKDHGFMPIVVEVKTPENYQLWLKQQQALKANAAAAEAEALNSTQSMAELMSLGEEIYVAHCAACHQTSGLGLPPAFPALKGSEITMNKDKISEHINVVFNGRSGTGMQGYGKQLTLKQIAAVVTYERNAWGNNSGDLVQAGDVNQLRSNANDDSYSPQQAEKKTALVTEKPKKESLDTYAKEELMKLGEKVYNSHCAACHQVSGLGIPPAFPALKGSSIVLNEREAHIEMVVHGSKKNPAMAAFAGQLNASELAAVITYERNAWGNNTGDIVQPSDIERVKAK